MDKDIKVKFIVSEDIQSQQIPNTTVSKNIIVNPVYILRSRWIPTNMSLGITILTSGIDFTKQQDVQIQIINNSSGSVIYDTGINPIQVTGGSTDNFTFNLELKNIPFENSGTYDIKFRVRDKEFSDEFKVLKSEDDI